MAVCKKPRVVLCGGSSCRHRHKKVRRVLEETLDQYGLTEHVEVRISRCQDRCKHGPVCTLMPGAFCYGDLSPKRVRKIVGRHIVQGAPIGKLLVKRKPKKKK